MLVGNEELNELVDVQTFALLWIADNVVFVANVVFKFLMLVVFDAILVVLVATFVLVVDKFVIVA